MFEIGYKLFGDEFVVYQTAKFAYLFKKNNEDEMWDCIREDGAIPIWTGNDNDFWDGIKTDRIAGLCEGWDDA